ncbi:MAG: molybdopterin guanine dinucleotide-containing S/N-oxide reductase [Chloroflexi bacterium]|nr:molybdopterin guanine dinucleotide-containing S/N-oxide reductase [Chloroflexota bacterium]
MAGTVRKRTRTSLHWGVYDIEVEGDRIVDAQPWAGDPDPSPIGQSIPTAVHHESRVTQPMVRSGWLKHGPQSGRGGRGVEPFVPVSWDRALDLVSEELQRVKESHGNEAIFGGSYGWASAGRFHHAQSQIHRFLNQIGGYVRSVNTYSSAASEVIVPHVFGRGHLAFTQEQTVWPVIAEHTGLVVMFGGMPPKNAQISPGGAGKHTTLDWLKRCRANGVTFINVSPLRDDAADFMDAEWLAPRPNSDTALMLGLAHTLVVDELCDRRFLETHCHGFERFEPYLLGQSDGQPKDAGWAAAISGIPEETIRGLARRMAATRTLITVAYSLQRADHGEQPFWMAAVLAGMLGQIGLPGGGIGYGYGAFGRTGRPARRIAGMALPQGTNPVQDFIPVARITDMLLHPGETLDYDGERLRYPDIRLIYWCGGNPFHHHQDLNRLVEAWQRPETIVVHEPWWNALARHADIVLPATTPLERNDIGWAPEDTFIFAMEQAIPPVGESRNDYDIFSDLARRMGVGDSFTEGRTENDWLRHLYGEFRDQLKRREDIEIPNFDEFWSGGQLELPTGDDERVHMAEFRNDPVKHPLSTPSGKIEIFSETIDGFGYDDCPGHPVWLEPAEWLGSERQESFPLHLISNQPTTRLHSQHDPGAVSMASKVQGREPISIHPQDASDRGIEDGDVVRVFNDRGACLAGVRVTDGVRPGVVILSTGAWYDPEAPGGLDRHGNPNVLTLDKGTSRLAQGPIAHSALVEIERFDGEPPPVRAFEQPAMVVPG